MVVNQTTSLCLIGSSVECCMQSKLLIFQLSGKTDHRQGMEHSGLCVSCASYFALSLPRPTLNKRNMIGADAALQSLISLLDICIPFCVIITSFIFQQGLPSDSFSTENGVMVTRGNRY